MHGEIKFWDLENKKLEKKIWTGGYNLLSMVQWSEKYIIFGDNNRISAHVNLFHKCCSFQIRCKDTTFF